MLVALHHLHLLLMETREEENKERLKMDDLRCGIAVELQMKDSILGLKNQVRGRAL